MLCNRDAAAKGSKHSRTKLLSDWMKAWEREGGRELGSEWRRECVRKVVCEEGSVCLCAQTWMNERQIEHVLMNYQPSAQRKVQTLTRTGANEWMNEGELKTLYVCVSVCECIVSLPHSLSVCMWDNREMVAYLIETLCNQRQMNNSLMNEGSRTECVNVRNNC